MATVWPHVDKQVIMPGTLISPTPVLGQTPFDTACVAHDAGDVLADALVEHWLPRQQ
jgi:hypothetical protein